MDGNSSEALVPTMDNTTIKCGLDGKREDNCVIFGGVFQVLLHPVLQVENVTLSGFTMTNARGVSVAAWGNPLSSAFFQDCAWQFNSIYSLLELYYEPQFERALVADDFEFHFDKHSPQFERALVADDFEFHFDNFEPHPDKHSFLDMLTNDYSSVMKSSPKEIRRTQAFPAMIIGFYYSSFNDNEANMGILVNAGGILEVYACEFSTNTVQAFLIGTLFGGYLFLHKDSKFINNYSQLYNVFLDSDSSLELNRQSLARDNTADTCFDGIFIESDGSHCLEGGQCHGTCCDFGDMSCDTTTAPTQSPFTQTEPTFEDHPKQGTAESASISTESHETCTGICVAFAVLVPLLVFAMALMVYKFVIVKRRHLPHPPVLGNEPATPMS